MTEFNLDEWIINNRNVFELIEIENISISAIWHEIHTQLEDEKITSIQEFLIYDIDIKKEIRFTEELTIDIIFNKYLELNINPLDIEKLPVYIIIINLTLWLYRKYVKNDHNSFLIASTYKKQYENNKNNYLNSNIDTDETDFINNELNKCETIILELKKPIYNNNGLGNIENEPTEFKKYLLFSIDKRKKFLKNILTSFNEVLPPQRIVKVKPDVPEKLEQLFEYTSKYKKVLEILVSKQLIEPNTYIWKDDTKGNKAYLAALIKDLHGKGYYKEKKRPKNEAILLICKNTFHWEVGIDTIKRSKSTDFDFSFIPIALTI